MRILHVGMGWFGEEVGGLARVMSQAASAQSRAGHEVRALVTGTGLVHDLSGGIAKAFAAPNEPLHRRLLAARSSLAREIEGFRPEIVSFHFALYGRPSLGLVRGRVPWMVHFHGPWALESRAEGAGRILSHVRKRLVERRFYRAAPRLVTLSRAFADILRDEYGVPEERIRVVQGGFDPSPFRQAPPRPEARSRLGFPQDRPLVVCVRRLARRMGLENLLEAVKILREGRPDVLVAVAGKGPLAQDLGRIVQEAGLEGNVRFLGFVPDADLPALYSAADLSVVPTVALEGFGLIVAESMAAGTPVVATRVGALPELLGGFAPALLADPEPRSIAAALGRGLDAGQRPGADACRKWAERWGWDAIVPALERVYLEAGAGKVRA